MSMRKTIRQRAIHCLGLDFRARARRMIQKDSRKVSLETVGRLSRGSVGTQLKDAMTEDDLEKERREARELDLTS